jgi:hypothetical protein
MAKVLTASVGTARLWTDLSISLPSTLSSVQVGSVCGMSDHAFYPRQMVFGWYKGGSNISFLGLLGKRKY